MLGSQDPQALADFYSEVLQKEADFLFSYCRFFYWRWHGVYTISSLPK